MKNDLIVGDIHAKNSNLDETMRLFEFIADSSFIEKVESVIFLGDLYDTHDVLRQTCIDVIQNGIKLILNKNPLLRVYILTGNHDSSSPHSTKLNALRLTVDNIDRCTVIDESNVGLRYGNYVFVPYINNNDLFVEMANKFSKENDILVSHQTYEGSQFENGFYAPNGIDQNKVHAKRIINGHIHTRSLVGKVLNVGSPRALNSNEINRSKSIYIMDKELNTIKELKTDHICKQFLSFEIKDDSDIPQKTWKDNDDVRFIVYGNQEFCLKKTKEILSLYKNVKIQTESTGNTYNKSINIESNSFDFNKELELYVNSLDISNKEKVWKKIKETLTL